MNYKELPDDELVRLTINFTQGGRGESAIDLSPELTRRLIGAMKELSRSTTRYSKILVWLTVTMIILAIIQIIQVIMESA